MILDIGPKSVAGVEEVLGRIKTLVWNGPFGAFETPPFDAATMAIAKKAASLTRQGKLKSVAGGGDTVAALNEAKIADEFTYVSAAGGAFLEWMEGKTLPGSRRCGQSSKIRVRPLASILAAIEQTGLVPRGAPSSATGSTIRWTAGAAHH
jgi:phosphoglycerate kinase